MRIYRLGMTLAVMGIAIGSAAVLAQSPSQTPPTSRNGVATTKESSPPSRPAQPPAEPARHFLRQATCSIPFTIDPSRGVPIELQLFVSADQGANWEFYGKSAPAAGSFTFRAPKDGEFWFALRTIEKSQLPADPRKLQPGLKVVFDTRPPQVNLDASVMPDGTVAIHCTAEDPSLDSDSLRIEYQSDPTGAWQTLSPTRGEGSSAGVLSARHAVRMDPHGQSALIRAEVRDRAGNNTVVSRQVNWSDAPPHRPGSPLTTPVSNVPRSNADGSVSWPRNNLLPLPTGVPPGNSTGELPPPKPSADPPPGTIKNEMLRNPYFPTAINPRRSSPNETAPEPERADSPGIGDSATSGDPEPLPGDPRPIPNVADDATRPNRTSQFPYIPRQLSPESAADSADRAFPPQENPNGAPPSALPSGERPRMTKSWKFNLDYEVQAIGRAALERVELWGTIDGGRTWTHWQDDEDRISPMEVRLDRDGEFGFRVVAVSNRQSTPTPQPGEPADIWIGVDTASPRVRITAAIPGEGDHAGHLDIRWQAVDTGFGDRPITLSFSEFLGGPWSTIAAGLANTGQYHWLVEPRLPREIYLRVEARDEAGNVGTHQTDPIRTAGLIPNARILGIRVPANDRSASKAHDSR